MPDRDKLIQATFYRTARGAEPVREWLQDLDKQDRKLIGTDIKTVEFGWPIGMPTCRLMGKGLHEVRTDLSRNRIARVLFSVAGRKMFLLHGFIKKSKVTPKADLALARDRKRKLESK
ncbi:MAG TPA: type II toxin-antitoxin system RelE/ParE family toxin [Kiloniellales bacterium]|jgi:phage-related protein